jgi:predicted metalloprotease
MNVYRVTVSKDMFVLAETWADAERIAVRNVNDDGADFEGDASLLKSAEHLSKDEKGFLIWHSGDKEITVEEAFGQAEAAE